MGLAQNLESFNGEAEPRLTSGGEAATLPTKGLFVQSSLHKGCTCSGSSKSISLNQIRVGRELINRPRIPVHRGIKISLQKESVPAVRDGWSKARETYRVIRFTECCHVTLPQKSKVALGNSQYHPR
jgi:uncharacterized protein (UPF0248 family)